VAEITPHWDQTDWGNLQLGSNSLPGKWEVEGEAARRVDVKERKDQDGAVIKDQGYSNAEITLVGRVATQDEFSKLQKALKEIHPRRKGAARDPLAVVHPALDTLGITAVYVLAIEAPRLGDDGIVELRIRCLEWTPQPKATAKRKQKAIAMGSGYTTEAFKGRGTILTDANGNEKIDLGLPPPRDSALAFLEPNRIAP
jgi:hypothetical protein